MGKIWKMILIGVVLIAIAVPLGFLIKSNFTQRLAEATKKGIDFGLGTKEAANLTDQTNQEINQMIENLTATSTATSTE